MFAEPVVEIVPEVTDEKNPVCQLVLQFDEYPFVTVLRGETRRIHRLRLLFCADNQVLPGGELRHGPPIVLDALTGTDRGGSIARSDIGVPTVGVIHAKVVF